MRFLAEEEVAIAEFHEEHKHLLDGTCNKPEAQQRRRQLWSDLAKKLNALNPSANRTWDEVKKKWQNLKSKAKVKHTEEKRSLLATGGGPSSSVKFTAAEEVVISNLGTTPQFSGIPGGIESGAGGDERRSNTPSNTILKSVNTSKE